MSLYAIECAGLLKIGYSENPERRVVNLFKSTSRYTAPRAAYEARGTQRLVQVTPGATKGDERMVHDALADYSIGCEWFVNEPAVIDLLEAFHPGDIPAALTRPEGSAYGQTPPAERGGGNADLAMSVLAKRRAKTA